MFRQVFCLLLLFILMTLVPSHVNNRRKRKHHLNSVFYDMFLTTNSNTLNEQLIVVLGLSLTKNLCFASFQFFSQLFCSENIFRLLGCSRTNEFHILQYKTLSEWPTLAIIVFLCNLCCSLAKAILDITNYCLRSPSFVEAFFPNSLNLLHALHGLECSSHQVTIVLHRTVTRLLKLKRRVLYVIVQSSKYHTNVLSIGTSESLGPTNLSRITSQIEILSAFRSAKTEHLQQSVFFTNAHFTVVSHKHSPMPRIDRSRTEVARLYSHPFCECSIMWS